MLGIVGNNVESAKFIGRRDMNMDDNLKALFDEEDRHKGRIVRYYPYFNDAKELFEISFLIHFVWTADNKQK